MSNEYHLPSDPRDYLAHIREIDSGVYGNATQNLPRGVIPVRRGRSFNQHLSSNNVVAVSNIPFLIMPGDGAANGCQFTGTHGAFTLSAAILANIGTSLAGCYAYFSANFGGSSLPAGWYWTEFSSDTAGIVYAENYTSGKASRPATKTAITPNLSGWVTGTTNEVVGPQGIILPGMALGKNGDLQCFLRTFGSTAAVAKISRIKLDSTTAITSGNVSNPLADLLMCIACIDSHSIKNVGRSVTSAPVGVGLVGATAAAASQFSVDTSVDTSLSITLQGNSNVAAPAIGSFKFTATYGE